MDFRKSRYSQAVDIGQRFGTDKVWGIRINAMHIDGESSVKNAKLNQKDLYINLDHRTTYSKTNILLGYDETRDQGSDSHVGFNDAVTSLPKPISGKTNLLPEWSYMRYKNYIAAVNHEQILGKHLTAFVNAGYHYEDWYQYTDGWPTAVVTDNAGDYHTSFHVWPLVNHWGYLGGGVKGDFQTGSVKHNYVLNVDRSWRTEWDADYSFDNNFTSNIYATSAANELLKTNIPSYATQKAFEVTKTGVSLLDTMSMDNDRLQLTVGVHHHKINYHYTDYGASSVDGKKIYHVNSDATTPTVSLLYKLNDQISAYASHSESFGEGSLVTGTYKNRGQILDPSKAKMDEVGIKAKQGRFLTTFSLFQIKQADTNDVVHSDGIYLEQQGHQKNKGAEISTAGSFGKWDVIGGISRINTKSSDGSSVAGVSKWNAAAGVVYHPDENFSVNGKVTFVGDTYVNTLGDTGNIHGLSVPSFARFDIGSSYQTQINHTPVTLSLTCYNVFDRKYWQAYNKNQVMIGSPRTFVLTAKFDL